MLFGACSLALYLGLELSYATLEPMIPLSQEIARLCYVVTYISNFAAVFIFTFYFSLKTRASSRRWSIHYCGWSACTAR